jgi:DNA-binding transcriptional LysR family regulator
MLAQAAAAGAGVALIPSFLIEPEMAAGSPVCPIDLPLATDEAYYLVWPEGGGHSPALRHFRAWINREARMA